MSRIVTLCICVLILSTSLAHAAVRITEIAWMGTAESQFGEWFELYNDGDEAINLADWKLHEDAGDQLVFTLTKSIPASGYLLVERTTASSPDPVPGISDESGTFGGSGFSNSGEDLVLKDDQGSTIQTLSFSSGWPAGDADTKQTMQWNGTKWVTAPATPKAALQGGGEDTPPAEIPKSGGSSTAWVPPKTEPRIVFSIPQTIYTTVSSEYSTKTFLEYGEAYNGLFLWNMGDGTTYKLNSPSPIKHIYKYPGKYTISFAYYRGPYDHRPFLVNSIEKNVVAPKITFSVIKDKGFQFTNSDTVPVDISGWVIVLPDQKNVELPLLTIIGSKEAIIMPFDSFDLNNSYATATLQTPERMNLVADEPVVIPKSSVLPASSYSTPLIEPSSVFDNASALTASAGGSLESNDVTKKSYTKMIVFGVALLLVIILFILVEKLKGRTEE